MTNVFFALRQGMPWVAFGGGLWCLVISTGWEQTELDVLFLAQALPFGSGLFLELLRGPEKAQQVYFCPLPLLLQLRWVTCSHFTG